MGGKKARIADKIAYNNSCFFKVYMVIYGFYYARFYVQIIFDVVKQRSIQPHATLNATVLSTTVLAESPSVRPCSALGQSILAAFQIVFSSNDSRWWCF